MSTYKLWELVNDRDDLHELVRGVIDDRVAGDGRPYIGKETYDEPTQALVYAVHQFLWNMTSKTYDTSRPPFTHKVTGMSPTKVLRKIAPALDLPSNDRHLDELARGVYSILSANQLMARIGRSGGKGGGRYMIREWPTGFQPKWNHPHQSTWLSVKDEADIRRQEIRAKELAGPVIVKYDLNTIPLPDPDPASILAYTKKVIAVAKRLQDERDELEARVKVLESAGQWNGVVDEIKALL